MISARLAREDHWIVCGHCAGRLGERLSARCWTVDGKRYRSAWFNVSLNPGFNRERDGRFRMTPRAETRDEQGRPATHRRGHYKSTDDKQVTAPIIASDGTADAEVECPSCKWWNRLDAAALVLYQPEDPNPRIIVH